MDTLLHAALSNAIVVVILAPIVSLVGRFSRRPALVHSLWLVVLLKLLTPPLWPVPFSWPVHSNENPAATASVVHNPDWRVEADPLSESRPTDKGTDDAVDIPHGVRVPLLARPERLEDRCRGVGASKQWHTHPHDLVAVAERQPAPEEPTPPTVTAPSTTSRRFWLMTVWLSGSALWLALACYRLSRFHRLLRLTQRAPANVQSRAHRLAKHLGLARCPGVRVVSAPVSPLLWAFLGEPRLLVPASLLERLTEEQWDTLLAHELAHLRRRDHWVRLLELAVIGLYWWHPVVWWARHKLREAEEQCCDAWVVWALPGAAEVYARTLVEAVTYLSGARAVLPLAASGIGQMHLLKRRLTMIMRGTTPKALSATGSLAVFGLAAVLLPLYPTFAWTKPGADPAEDQPPAGGARATITAGVPAAGVAGVAQDHSSTGAVAEGAEDPSRTGGFFGRFSAAGEKNYPENVEDAQDDVDLLRVQLDLRRAERREVEARLRQAQLDLQRYQRLGANGGVSSDTVEHAKTEVMVQEARLAAKDAQIKEAALRLKQAERRLARFHSRTGPALQPSTPSGPRPSGSAPPPRPPAGGFSGGSGFAGRGTGFSGGIGGMGGISGGIGGGIGGIGGISGGLGGGIGGFSGMAGGGVNLSAYEHRLAEVEKKLQSLLEEMKALRKERRREQQQSDKKAP